MLDNEIFIRTTDERGRERLAIRLSVPQGVLRNMGLLTGETGGNETDLRVTQIPVKAMRGIRDRCMYTADFGTVENDPSFAAPVQLVTIPCRSALDDGQCNRMGPVESCPLFGMLSAVESPDKVRVDLIVAPVLPGGTLPAAAQPLLVQKRDLYQRSLSQWEDALAPVNMLMDATLRGLQFWARSWFGSGGSDPR
ncbi:MAG: hypothetical protein H7838_01715 [Magnetococcus sp. DMHC-8]